VRNEIVGVIGTFDENEFGANAVEQLAQMPGCGGGQVADAENVGG
jgi:hypothetical protein